MNRSVYTYQTEFIRVVVAARSRKKLELLSKRQEGRREVGIGRKNA